MRRGRARIGATIVALTALATATGAGAVSSSGVPAPEVPASPARSDVVQVFGANAAGDVYLTTGTPQDGGNFSSGILHADGTLTPLPAMIGYPAVVVPDGALWYYELSSLWRVAPDGTRSEHPLPGGEPGTSSGVVDLAVGADGRVWFTDSARSEIGSIALDGTGITVATLPGAGDPRQLAAGSDGRLWVARSGGVIQAVETDGTATTYGSLGTFVQGLRASAGDLYAITENGLVGIASDGTTTLVRSEAFEGFDDVGTADGWAWFRSGGEIVAVSPSGRIAMPSLSVPFHLLDASGAVAIAPDARGGFIGSSNETLVRIPSGVLAETFTASGQIIQRNGANWLRITASGRTPGGAPLNGPVDAVLWGGAFIPSIPIEARAVVITRLELVGGRATAEIPITADLVRAARPSGLLHTGCCSIAVRRPETATGPGLASWQGPIRGGLAPNYYGNVEPSTTMIWLDAVHRIAVGRSMDRDGQVYWAGQLAAGRATRVSVARSIVGSASARTHRVDDTYQRWFGRAPSPSERTYWSGRLASGTTTSGMDLALAAKPAARDALGATNAQRGRHLAQALHLDDGFGPGLAARLDAGVPWATVVHDAYWSTSAMRVRLAEMGPTSGFTPSFATLAGAWRRTGDEREALITILATRPVEAEMRF